MPGDSYLLNLTSMPAMPRLPRATELAHEFVRARLSSGAIAIDATAGNGHDTEFLASLSGPEGRVIAFDIQAAAIEATRERLHAAGLLERVTLRQESHECIADVGSFAVAMFNLGYLPGGDKDRITETGSTIRALEGAVRGLLPGGIITIVCYPGHPGGREESDAVVAWASGLEPDNFRAMRCEMLLAAAPFLVAVERIHAKSTLSR
jgi:predicted methyltransferase